MTLRRLLFPFLLAVSAIGSASAPAQALSESVSGPGTVAYLVVGAGAPWLRDGRAGRDRSWRTLDALGTTVLVTEGLKAGIREERPNRSGSDSFPSEHTALAFTVATMESQFHPREAPLWYLGATLIGASRLDLDEHYLHDVAVGAAIGFGVARLELALPHGVLLQPIIGRDGSRGVALRATF